MSSGIIKAQPSVEQIKAAVEEQTRLANAAPEMFEVLLALVGAPPKYGRDGVATMETRDVVEWARKVIAKAEGRGAL